jgi:hypothetical protein
MSTTMPLHPVSLGRGQWVVQTTLSGKSVTPYTLSNRKAATAARNAILAALPGIPWNADSDILEAALRDFRAGNGDGFRDAMMRALAGDPAADPHGSIRAAITSRDIARQEHAEYVAREKRDGFTERVEVGDVQVGDSISFRYTLTKTRYGFQGMAPLGTGPGSARTILVRGTVAGEGRIMTRHGNNHDEFMNGLRFPLAGATWMDQDGNTGTLTAAVTTSWLTSVRRTPKSAHCTGCGAPSYHTARTAAELSARSATTSNRPNHPCALSAGGRITQQARHQVTG